MSSPEKQLDRAFLREMSMAVEEKLPDNYGFLILAAPFDKGGDSRLVYTSNISRETAIKQLKEFLFRIGESEDWMKHIN